MGSFCIVPLLHSMGDVTDQTSPLSQHVVAVANALQVSWVLKNWLIARYEIIAAKSISK
jgi:hypothetical protein